MFVKIGDTVYNSEDTPICIELNEGEKEAISFMKPSDRKFASAPKETFKDPDNFLAWMGNKKSFDGDICSSCSVDFSENCPPCNICGAINSEFKENFFDQVHDDDDDEANVYDEGID